MKDACARLIREFIIAIMARQSAEFLCGATVSDMARPQNA